ncbi:oligogalacturonate-specific porin KdgM family protein [Vibrio hannami]|uniref:oligogalacturonate-specific porin KdgM family protein n=1 Tax=Vibrio hannami TaxID=2717094 RepID=UPI002410A39B|nr:oligogalacturonate-specific porin KdgM family protein [Vibrio hannami]MDG3085115.1 oligogalacturonate-specific porin KdgM family protein [Vibrio hannami]
MPKIFKLATTAAIVLIASASVSAASLDFRQEYKHDSEDYSSRVKIGSGIGNIYFGVEAMQKGKPFSEWESKGNEFDIGYKYKINDKWMLIPGMPVTFFPGSVSYKPQIRVQYKFDSGLVTKLRYRHQFREFSDDRDSETLSYVTANVDYQYDHFQFGLEGNYTKGHDDQVFFDNGDTNWDLGVKIGYKGEDWNWRPYVEFANVSVSGTKADRQLRSRVGITYSF